MTVPLSSDCVHTVPQIQTLDPIQKATPAYQTRNGKFVPVRSQSHGVHHYPELPDASSSLLGRAIYVLQQTLPEFFSTGLITSVDKATGSPKSASTSIPVLNANPLDYQGYGNEDVEVIYSSKIGLSYTPPVALPVPFPATLHVEGL